MTPHWLKCTAGILWSGFWRQTLFVSLSLKWKGLVIKVFICLSYMRIFIYPETYLFLCRHMTHHQSSNLDNYLMSEFLKRQKFVKNYSFPRIYSWRRNAHLCLLTRIQIVYIFSIFFSYFSYLLILCRSP